MKNQHEVLDRIEAVLDELRSRPDNSAILVEGRKDVEALHELGIEGEIIKVQSSGKNLLEIAEILRIDGKNAYILTDWDRKGGQLSRLLKNALSANQVPYDEKMRAELSKLCRSEIKDVESLPTYLSLLRNKLHI